MKKGIILIAFAGLLLFGGCKPTETIRYIDRWHETIKIDSVYKYEKDTMYLTKKGDTIFVNKEKTKIDYKYKYLSKVDTVTNVKTEYKVKTETKIKEVKITRAFGWFDWGLLGIALLYGIFRLLKYFKVLP